MGVCESSTAPVAIMVSRGGRVRRFRSDAAGPGSMKAHFFGVSQVRSLEC